MAVDPNLLTGLGCVLSIFLTATGSAIASGHASTYAIRGPDYKSFIPIVQAGVLAIYGILISILLVGKFNNQNNSNTDEEESINNMISQADGYRYLSAGLSVGLACLASGWGMARFLQQLNNTTYDAVTASSSNDNGDNNNNNDNNTGTEPLLGNRRRLTSSEGVYGKESFVKTILAMIFLEAIGLYGLIVAVVLIFR